VIIDSFTMEMLLLKKISVVFLKSWLFLIGGYFTITTIATLRFTLSKNAIKIPRNIMKHNVWRTVISANSEVNIKFKFKHEKCSRHLKELVLFTNV
jgi:hypothetical protein